MAAKFPETFRYRLKNRLLGDPLTTERLSSERLNKRTALAVLSSDVISSSAYASEQALIPLVQLIGVAAFSLLMPVTIAVIVVLVFVTLSYLEVVKFYTKAGGAYVVSRENLGPKVAQVAAVSLLIDYTLTVCVSVAAGVAAVTSVFPSLAAGTVWIAIGLVILITYANLRGVREAGKVFAFPTYFFVANMAVLLVVGIVRHAAGQLHAHSINLPGAFPAGHSGTGLIYGASIFVLLRSFASGGSALTGTEAISNGVSVFKKPESRNARITMVWMACILGTLVLGVSFLATAIHPVPYISGTPTVISQIAKDVYGQSGVGDLLYFLLQASTMVILILAANTSFTGFPYLASFAAEDSYLPRRLMRRGHRLVFSSGIIVLAVVSCLLLLITQARVDKLIPLYAIGVFTGFTMAGAGMFRFHLRNREPGWRRGAMINGGACVLTFIVDIIIIITKFTEGAWAIVVILPLGVVLLLRLHRQYSREDSELEVGAVEACEAPLLRRHVVIVLIDALDLAAARAIQYARTLLPDELRVVHFDLDSQASRDLQQQWSSVALSRLPLDVIECPDRRPTRAAIELVADAVSDGETEVTVLLPRRGFISSWRLLLHDRTADKIATAVSRIPHASATIVPYNLEGEGDVRFPGIRALFERTPSDDGRDHDQAAGGGVPPVPDTVLEPVAAAADGAAGAAAADGAAGAPPGGRGGRPGRKGPCQGPQAGQGQGQPRARRRRPRAALSGHPADRRGPLAPAGQGRRPRAVGAGAAARGDIQPGMCPGGQLGRSPPRLPGQATGAGHRAGRPDGGRRHGGGVAASAGDAQSRL